MDRKELRNAIRLSSQAQSFAQLIVAAYRRATPHEQARLASQFPSIIDEYDAWLELAQSQILRRV